MVELKRTELTVRRERAVLVAHLWPSASRNDEAPLAELTQLAKTAGARVVGTLVQTRARLDPALYLGPGKARELASLAQSVDADAVIFDNDLSPAQTRNLEQLCDTKVLDRSELILDIFATRARAAEAKLQVELAQLEYALPRLKRMWTHLSRIKRGIGMRGPGEQQLEEDRRLVQRRITDLKKRLHRIEGRKAREVASRNDELTVSLVGYTNAGKSTLMNALTGSRFRVEDKLFATVDTRTRIWPIKGWGKALLSDTVGFIRDLPHHLVASFKATLEEACRARILLHLVDASDPGAGRHVRVVQEVLRELGSQAHATILVINKIDIARDRAMLDVLRRRHPPAVAISARRRQGFDDLAQAVVQVASREFALADVSIPATDGRAYAYLSRHAEVRSCTHKDGRLVLCCRVMREHLDRLIAAGVDVDVRERESEDTHG